MKKIYLLLATMMGITAGASAQIIADIEAQIILPPEASTQTSPFVIPCKDSFDVRFLLINRGPGVIGATDTVLLQIPLNTPNQAYLLGHGGQPVAVDDTIIDIGDKLHINQLKTLLVPNSSGGLDVAEAPFDDGNYAFFVLAAGFRKDTTVIKDNNKENNIALSGVSIHCQSGISFNGLDKQNLSIYPNPAANEVRFMATLATGNASARVTDIAGRTVLVKDYGRQAAGNHELSLDLNGVNNGIYYIELISDGKRFVSKLTVQK